MMLSFFIFFDWGLHEKTPCAPKSTRRANHSAVPPAFTRIFPAPYFAFHENATVLPTPKTAQKNGSKVKRLSFSDLRAFQPTDALSYQSASLTKIEHDASKKRLLRCEAVLDDKKQYRQGNRAQSYERIISEIDAVSTIFCL